MTMVIFWVGNLIDADLLLHDGARLRVNTVFRQRSNIFVLLHHAISGDCFTADGLYSVDQVFCTKFLM